MEQELCLIGLTSYEVKSNGDINVILDISNTEPDLVNDIVAPSFLKSIKKQILERNMKLDIEHEAFRGDSVEEKELNKTIIPAGRMVEPVIKDYKNENGESHQRLTIKGLINRNRSDFKSIKGNIIDGMLDSASIAFIATDIEFVTKGKTEFRILKDGILLNVGLTGNPINTTVQMRDIIVKSLENIDDYKAMKKADPELENKLIVKSSKATTRTQARNAAINDSDDDEDEDEETKKYGKKKKQVKSYEKDGGHSHEGADPIGEHNHPEIENRVRSDVEFLHDRISSLSERLNKFVNGSQDTDQESPMVKGKSNSKKRTNIQKEVKMTEENEKTAEGESNESNDSNDESNDESGDSKESNDNAEPLNEVKSLLGEVLAGQKSIEARIKKLEAKDDDDVKAPEKKANSKAHGAENSDSQNLKTDTRAVGGLSAIK